MRRSTLIDHATGATTGIRGKKAWVSLALSRLDSRTVASRSLTIRCNVVAAIGAVCLYQKDIREHLLTTAPTDPLYQDVPWSYSFNAHHDIYRMIELSGGADTFVSRLEKFFEPGVYDRNEAFNNTLYNPGNQPAYVRIASPPSSWMRRNANL